MKKTARICILLIITSIGHVGACAVPVFRYALERWAADTYLTVIFYDSNLSGAAKENAGKLAATAVTFNGDAKQIGEWKERPYKTNIDLRLIPVDRPMSRGVKRLWEEQKATRLPWVVVRYPFGRYVGQSPLWSGPLEEMPVDQMIASPARKKLAQKLLSGKTAVWVLVGNGKKRDERRAATTIESFCRQSEKELTLPELSVSDMEEYIEGAAKPPLELSFDQMFIDSNDPKEKFFIKMLLATEPALIKFKKKPVAFPVFGRGRVLYAMAGEGISGNNILEANAFLTGECACTVKDQNPGTDLLIGGGLQQYNVTITENTSPVPLRGLEGFMQAQ
jgi:hypothetical protein